MKLAVSISISRQPRAHAFEEVFCHGCSSVWLGYQPVGNGSVGIRDLSLCHRYDIVRYQRLDSSNFVMTNSAVNCCCS